MYLVVWLLAIFNKGLNLGCFLMFRLFSGSYLIMHKISKTS